MYNLKPEFYDSFRCIADKCPNTCCAGWKIELDEEIIQKYIDKGIDFNVDKCCMNMNDGKCIMLDECGLCKLVKQYGDDMLSYTCKTYPRNAFILENCDGEEIRELHMTNACPVVLQLLKDLDAPLSFVIDDNNVENFYDVYGVEKRRNARNMIIDLLQIMDMPLWVKLYIAYKYASKIEKADVEDKKIESIYKSKDYLKELYKRLDSIKISFSDKLEYIKIFFKSILDGSSIFYKSMLDFVDELNMDAFMEYYVFLEECMADYDMFFQNYSVNMIFNSCVRDADVDKHIEKSVILLIMEIQFITFHTFSLWYKNGKTISWKEIQYVASNYARMDHILPRCFESIDILTESGLLDEGLLLLLLK